MNTMKNFTGLPRAALSPGRRAGRLLATGALAGLLAACAGPKLQDFAGQSPAFDFRHYFDGAVQAHGMVSDRGGKVLRRFVVTMRGDWVGDAGTLDEQFVYDDGERQHRIWRVNRLADGSYTGRADDVVGEARGGETGPAFNWRYTLRVALQGREVELDFDDWMVRIDDRTVINRATMHKFGVRVGEVTLSFTRAPAGPATGSAAATATRP